MGVPTIHTGPMTVEEFYAFTDTRPDEEKWELIDGEPILNAAPSRLHQRIVKNLVFALTVRERELSAAWQVLPGLGVRVSDTNRPEPDVLGPIPGTTPDRPHQQHAGQYDASAEVERIPGRSRSRYVDCMERDTGDHQGNQPRH